jgi:hypothetical protein
MNGYESRRVTLDPGLTALALRSLRERDGHYPFVDQAIRRRRPRRLRRVDAAGWLHSFLTFLVHSRGLAR